jgi:hypothetical protein
MSLRQVLLLVQRIQNPYILDQWASDGSLHEQENEDGATR